MGGSRALPVGRKEVDTSGPAVVHQWVHPWSSVGDPELCEGRCLCSLWPRASHTVQFSSFAHSYLTLCDPMDCSTPGFPVHHQLPELTQTHVHRVSDAIQSSHPLLSPSPPAFNLSQHQGLSNESVLHIKCQSIGVSASASVLPMNIQD